MHFLISLRKKSRNDFFNYSNQAVKHNEEQEKNCFCEICGKAFANPGNLKGHITVVHNQVRTVPKDVDVNVDPISK